MDLAHTDMLLRDARDVKALLEHLSAGRDLTRAGARTVFEALVQGELEPVVIAAMIMALKCKGEQPEEIAGAAEALRGAALPFPKPTYGYADNCGTGGDGMHTVNISTAGAFIAAELGVPVAKHGNRSVSSRCGSADVLEACGVKLQPSPEVARRCLDEVGLCFLMAPQYHAGLRHAVPVRRALRTRTMFNLLGPLVNPATPPWQVMGVYDPRLCEPLARTLGLLGCEVALVVHGSGLDEIALHGPTTAARLYKGHVDVLTLVPEDAGVTRAPIEALAGGDPDDNARWLRQFLAGDAPRAHAEAVALNVGALVWSVGRSPTLEEGVAQALDTIRSGRAAHRLDALARLSHGEEALDA